MYTQYVVAINVMVVLVLLPSLASSRMILLLGVVFPLLLELVLVTANARTQLKIIPPAASPDGKLSKTVYPVAVRYEISGK